MAAATILSLLPCLLSPVVWSQGTGEAGSDYVSECPLPDGFFADAFDCDRYYECKNNVIKEHVCKDGMVFNDYSTQFGRCDFPFTVDCSDRPKLQEPNPTPNCPRQNGYFAHPDPTVCDKFFFCSDGTANPITCPASLIFDPKRGTCGWPEDAKRSGCAAEEIFQFKCPKDRIAELKATGQQHPRYADTTDCQFFYVCIDGVVPRKNGCPLGQVFNEVNGVCDEPGNVPECADYYKDDPRVTTTSEKPKVTRTRPNNRPTRTRTRTGTN